MSNYIEKRFIVRTMPDRTYLGEFDSLEHAKQYAQEYAATWSHTTVVFDNSIKGDLGFVKMYWMPTAEHRTRWTR
jgi:hypothetical protein